MAWELYSGSSCRHSNQENPCFGADNENSILSTRDDSVDPIGVEDRILMFTKDVCTQEGTS
jgi:hypothetical protein